MCRNDPQTLTGSRSRFGRLALCLTAVTLLALPMRASAVILIEVISPLILFEIEGTSFAFYSTSARTRLQIADTEAEWSRTVNVQGQQESRPELAVYASSRSDPLQRVCIEIDVSPLRGRATERSVLLNATCASVGPAPLSDPALAALGGSLILGFDLENQTKGHDSKPWFAVYRLRSVQVD
jgi:hypothetical protein